MFVLIFILFFSIPYNFANTHSSIKIFSFAYVRVRNVLKNLRCFSFHVKLFCGESILFACEPYTMLRETVLYFCHKGLYSSNNVLFGTTLKTDSGTQMMNLLLNVQCVKHPETRGLNVHILLYSWICNEHKEHMCLMFWRIIRCFIVRVWTLFLWENYEFNYIFFSFANETLRSSFMLLICRYL